ncbi:MAG: hypothetical protein HC793_00340 [Aquincola sp.]|nr:hypothetical protein [Aquincola sp.]
MIIEPKHFDYLVIQRGEVSDHRHDFNEWKNAYEKSLEEILASIEGHLPDRCTHLLDIGGGMGGIDVLLHRHFGGKTEVHILDGLEDPPEVKSHANTFSNAEVASDFLRVNGVRSIGYHWPRPLPHLKFDLIVSFAAYCFHIPPTTYFDVLTQMSKPGTVFIFDVRASNTLWLEQLVVLLGKPVVLERGKKHVRLKWTRES